MINKCIYKLRQKYPKGYITITPTFHSEHSNHVESWWELYIEGQQVQTFDNLVCLLEWVDEHTKEKPFTYSQFIKECGG